ncbi:MAG: chromosomal replication initiator protein DnaA [Coprobacter sp.]|nr:chromosomal replication initiator protein DnaA [Coprobacter sp.]
MSSDHVSLWDRCLTIIRDNVSKEIYDTWFEPIVPYSFDDNVLILQVPSHFYFEYLERNFQDILKKVLFRVFGEGIKLKYKVTMVSDPRTEVDIRPVAKSAGAETRPAASAVPLADPFRRREYEELDSQLNPVYNFENYCQSTCNQLARAAGLTIAANPGNNAFNPFFLFGESGVGKTHLIQAIGAKIKENNPQARVLYISSHLFQVQYTSAVRNNTVNDFINFYQSIDVLLIDDIQELAGKMQTQNTFFHIFNHLHQNHKQLVLTSDRPPVSLEGMVPRLLSRFKWGLTASVERPDYELRRNILLNKIHHEGLSIPDEVVEYISRHVTDNVRDLEGVVVSLMAHATLFNRDVTVELAERVLSSCVHIEKKQITVDTIKQTVCDFYNMDTALLQAKCRKREIVQARQISMYLAKKYTDSSLSYIGTAIGKKDHATVLHACKTIGDQLEIDKVLRTQVAEIEQQLRK